MPRVEGCAVSADKQSECGSSVRGNADIAWTEFDPEAYFQQYYGEPHRDDEDVIRLAVEAIKPALPEGELDIVDVGTGPNLIPLFCALPRARTLTVWEYAPSNIAWLKAELARQTMRPQWRHFWDLTRGAYRPEYALPENPMPDLRAKCAMRQGSIFELPERAFNVATMFFCAESITGRQDEFETACAAFARTVRPGGTLIASFLVRSKGYVVAGKTFPGLNLSVEAIERVFRRHLAAMRTVPMGLVDREVRSGYYGFVFLAGIAR